MAENLQKRQWESRMLVKMAFPFNDGKCECCKKPLKKWSGVYYGVFSDCNTLYDFEYSFETNYCRECAESEAERTRKAKYYTSPMVVNHIDNIRDDGCICERTIYEDGSVVESTADSIKNAERWW